MTLEDSAWAEMRYIQFALAAGTVLATLGRLEIIGLFPWIFVALGLMSYIVAAIFSGRYFSVGRSPDEDLPRSTRKRRPASSEGRSQHKRKARRRG